MKLTAKIVRDLFHYDPLTGFFTWKSSGNRAGGYDGDGYWVIGIDYELYRAHRIAWLWMTGKHPSRDLDHIDANRSNNQWSNLREASQSQNEFNKKIRGDNKSGYKGVRWHRRGNKWNSRIIINGKEYSCGLFSNLTDAAISYNTNAAYRLGEFARINSISPSEYIHD